MSATRLVPARDGALLAIEDWPGDPARLPLLCLPGLLRHGRDFVHVAARLGGRRRVLAPHWRGRGDSPRAEDWRRYAAPALLADLLDQLAALRVRRAIVLGTSMGGLLGLALAALRPGGVPALLPVLRAAGEGMAPGVTRRLVAGLLRPVRVTGLVLNDIGPTVDGGGLDAVRHLTAHMPPQPDWPTAAAGLAALLPHLSFRTGTEWLGFARNTYREEAGRLVADWDPAIARTLDAPVPDLWPLWHAARSLPVLVVHGAISDLLSETTVARMQATHPAMRLARVPGVGHTPSLDEAEAAGPLLDFLETLP